MASKYEFYSRMAEETADGLTKSRDQWTSFLKTAGRMGKYPYEDQLMIFAQRPDATACAEYDLWNSTMHRYVRRGAKGIALIDNSGDYPRLKYVFDVSDTGTRKNSRDVNLWEMRPEHKKTVQETLDAVFDVSSADPFDVQIGNIASWLSVDYWMDHEAELGDIVAGSYLEGYDEDNRRMSFLNAAAASIKYQVLSRCVDDPDSYFNPEEFSPIFDYNTRKAVNALGTAVSQMSRRIFREIEVTIRNYDRNLRVEEILGLRETADSDGKSKSSGQDLPIINEPEAVSETHPSESLEVNERTENDTNIKSYTDTERSTRHDERTGLHAERGLPDPEPGAEGREPGAARQVREDAQDIPAGEPSDPLQRPGADPAAVHTLEGDRRDGTPEAGADDGGTSRKEPGTGEEIPADGLGAAYEQPESAGGGDDSGGAYLQLTLNLFPTEQQQIDRIDEAAESEMPSALSFSAEDIDHVLRLGCGSAENRMEITAGYMAGKSMDEIADTLKKQYRGGAGLLTDNSRLSAWFDEDGIRISAGDRARYAGQFQLILWEDAAVRIRELLDTGRFASNVELAEAPGHFRTHLAQSIWYLRHDLSEDARQMDFFPSVDRYRGGRFPEKTAQLAEALADPEALRAVTSEMGRFSDVYAQARGLLRFHYHNIPEILNSLHSLSRPWHEYSSDMPEVPEAGHFITEDEVDEALCNGSRVSGGKMRIYEYFSNNHTTKELADFLREEYGTGGRSGAFANNAGSFEDHDGKGIRFTKPGCANVSLTWNAAAKRIAALINEDRYLIPAEKAQLDTANRFSVVEVGWYPSHTAYSIWDEQTRDYYRDADGLTIDFLSERRAEDYRQDLIESLQEEMSRSPLDKAKDLIDKYCMEEFSSPADFDDLRDVGIGYTTVTNNEYPVEASVNLIDFRLERWLNGKIFDIRQYDSLEELINHELYNLDFNDLMDVSDDELDAVLDEPEVDEPEIGAPEEQEPLESTPIQRMSNAEQEPEFPYHIGDTVYLEDGKAFVIDSIGMFDVHLRDPEQVYPVFRAESRENFLRLVERYPQPQIPATNFHITDDHLGEGGPKQKYAMNIAAIRTLLTVESENRNATPEEQAVLSRYVGWGSLPDAFDPNKPAWAEEYRELKSLLSDDEYAAARASTLNAHYTSPVVIRAIYDAVGQMGFTSGNILEPSMGVGNFFGLLPDGMRDSRLYGVELDPVSGRIAKKLYPNADIIIGGFESTDRRDFYDLAVGNVPFGDYRVSDRPYDKLGFSIHNYFFAKALDQVRPGGIVAFVTSRYTMDAKSPDVRKYLAQRADLLGAIRLPDNAFKANAGTEVVSDIIFLQKRETPIEIEPEWVHLGLTPGGYPINSYFADHPEMVLGELREVSTPYGRKDYTVAPIPEADLAGQLKNAVSQIHGRYEATVIAFDDTQAEERDTIPADPAVKNYSFAAVGGDVYFREDSVMRKVELGGLAKERVLGMIGLRETVNELIEYQLEDYSDAEIAGKQQELEEAYDAFTEKYGLINSRPNARVFADDSSYYLLCSLEDVDEEGNLVGKADMFTKRTIRPDRSVTHVDTPAEALAVSIGERGKPDLPFMAELLGTPGDYSRITEELSGVIFRDPLEASETDITKGWHTADDYLSGNVREKLRVAKIRAESDSAYAVNVAALEKAQPKELDASEIDVRLGATWIDVDYIQQFMEETFETPFYLRRAIEVNFSSFTAEWQVTGKTRVNSHDVAAYVTYGTDRANAYRILEESLNLKDIRIYDTVEDADGKQKRILNKKETTLAQQKQQAIKDAFRDWVWKDPYRREELCRKYNELFNSTRPREYDGSHIHFVGMNPEIMLREHQKNAIAHILYGGNTLLAHEVGAGKTFEMAAAAMESKRLGLCQKSLFVVPNHLTIQWANEFLRLYPSAKLLVATRKDFEASRRKKFCARIATGDYDAIIIGHSQFERIPVSTERQQMQLEDQIGEIEDAIASMKYQRGENFTIKQMEKTRRSLQARLDKLLSTERKDDVVTFEQLGVDRLFVDESQYVKNLFLYTKMRNVAGLSTSESQRSSDMFMKCRYLDEITGGRGVVFATGTPVSNSMTELYTVMRYLQYGSLQKMGLSHFDCWASTFGETTTAIELAPEGTGYRARTRFAKFFNLPELMNLFKEVADIKTSDQLDLPVPEAEYETVVVQPSEFQEEMVQDLSERAALVHAGAVDPSEDNMLKITSDGRKIGLDQRLMNDFLPDDPGSKLNACVNNVFRIWEEGTPEKLTQLLFCDMSTPKKDDTFNVYDDIRNKLIARGVPEEEVAFIHSADTEVKKKDLFAKVRSGQVRILMGSTQKMGAGTNVQDRLIAVHHLDVGWRPADMTQRNGRIIRQGNQNKKVQVYQYVTEGTFDAYLYQTLENKQKFISQIMTSKSPVRSCDDVDEQALSYAEIKALCAGSPLIKEKMDLDIDVARLKVLKADHRSKQYRLEDQLLKYFPAEIERQQGYIRGFTKDMETVAAHPHPEDSFAGMEVAGRTYHEKAEAGASILAVCKTAKSVEGYPLGSYRGFSMQLSFDSFEKTFCIYLKGEMTHRVPIGNDARGNLIRLDNALGNIPSKLEQAETKLSSLEQQQEAAMQEVGKPFPQEAELAEKSARLAKLDAELNMDDGSAAVRRGRDSGDDCKQDDARPSVLNDLKEKAGQVVPLTRDARSRREVIL